MALQISCQLCSVSEFLRLIRGRGRRRARGRTLVAAPPHRDLRAIHIPS